MGGRGSGQSEAGVGGPCLGPEAPRSSCCRVPGAGPGDLTLGGTPWPLNRVPLPLRPRRLSPRGRRSGSRGSPRTPGRVRSWGGPGAPAGCAGTESRGRREPAGQGAAAASELRGPGGAAARPWRAPRSCAPASRVAGEAPATPSGARPLTASRRLGGERGTPREGAGGCPKDRRPTARSPC